MPDSERAGPQLPIAAPRPARTAPIGLARGTGRNVGVYQNADGFRPGGDFFVDGMLAARFLVVPQVVHGFDGIVIFRGARASLDIPLLALFARLSLGEFRTFGPTR